MLKHTTKIPGKNELENRCKTVDFYFRAKGDRLGEIYNIVKTFFKPINFQEQHDYKNGEVDAIIQGNRKVPYVIHVNYRKPKSAYEGVNYRVEITFPENVRDELTPVLKKKLEGIMG